MADAPYTYWVGMTTQPDTSAEELAKFNDFYSNVHRHEVVGSYPGFTAGIRYELCEPDPRGEFGPQWLAVYEMDSEAAAKKYIEIADGPPEGRPNYTAGPEAFRNYIPWWRMIWHRIAPTTGDLASGGAPYIYLVGMNVPEGTTEAGMREFDEFYTSTHVPEVVDISKFRSGARYELYREFSHPAPGCPQFMAAYEGDEESIERRRHRDANPTRYKPLSSGPPTWEAHDTLWRLLYKRI